MVTHYTDSQFEISGRKIGSGQPCFIIAEAGVNHNGDLALAFKLVDAAVQVGADAVKFQTYRTDQLVIPEAPKAEYQRRTTDSSETQYEMLQRLELSPEMHQKIIARCEKRGITFLSSPFDEASVELLYDLQVPAFKIPSGEITNTPLVTRTAKKGKPMIVSTGMAYLSEVELAVRAIHDTGNTELALLQCTSNYPANTNNVNLKAMQTMNYAFGVPTGYSDHTLGIEIPLAATAMGACIIEKHLTLDTSMPGPDHAASLEPDQFLTMVNGIRIVETALGNGLKIPADSEFGTAEVARKSIVAIRDITAGETLTDEVLGIKRPGSGLPPSMWPNLLGRSAGISISAGTLLTLDMLA